MTLLSYDILIAYVLGGLTFLPLCLAIILIHGYLTLPVKGPSDPNEQLPADGLRQPDDDAKSLLSGKSAGSLLKEFQENHEPDVAAGYFAVCREYVPGGVNGKPPERTTPAGTVVSAESPSVYQNMYRSIFDRRQTPSLDPGKAEGKTVKRASNVFFVVLRHGHLMLYEDSEQLEVKHVVSLGHHIVSIYGGGEEIPEGELWIKRNAIRLERKAQQDEETTAKPFLLFSENCSDKEDFYFALLQNQEVREDAETNPPRPLHYKPKDIIGLVQKLHSSEGQLQTRWINGLIGRLFLAMYKTAEVEDFVRQKITKKIARVKKPAFLSGIVLQKIDVGDCAPQITNPKLKDLTIHGDCCVEADVQYNGHFRLEIAATARLDLGARFKAREVNLVLAVVVKKLNGHALLKFKPPPSNRMWVTFEHMPDMELAIEPIVSSRQITYGVILRAIQSRIREVVAETVVLPHWDDIPFTDTTQNAYRGGIWADQKPPSTSLANQAKIPDEAPEDGAENNSEDVALAHGTEDEAAAGVSPSRSLAEDAIRPKGGAGTAPKKTAREPVQDVHSKTDKPPKALRSTSFASAANPLLSNASADFVQREKSKANKRQKDATSAMMAISNRSRPTSPDEKLNFVYQESQPAPSAGENLATLWSVSKSTQGSVKAPNHSVQDSHDSDSTSLAPSQVSLASTDSRGSKRSIKSAAEHLESKAAARGNKKSMAAVGAAAAAAKKWGWGILSRNPDHNDGAQPPDLAPAGTPDNPIGRGQPLPPPGQPLPFPNSQRSMTMQSPSPKRKRPPSTLRPQRPQKDENGRSSPLPALPHRRRVSSLPADEPESDGLLVVEVPASEPPGLLEAGGGVSYGANEAPREGSSDIATDAEHSDTNHSVSADGASEKLPPRRSSEEPNSGEGTAA